MTQTRDPSRVGNALFSSGDMYTKLRDYQRMRIQKGWSLFGSVLFFLLTIVVHCTFHALISKVVMTRLIRRNFSILFIGLSKARNMLFIDIVKSTWIKEKSGKDITSERLRWVASFRFIGFNSQMILLMQITLRERRRKRHSIESWWSKFNLHSWRKMKHYYY
jgi:hypothetical protein